METKKLLLMTLALIYENAIRHGGDVKKAKEMYEKQKEVCGL